VDVGDVRAVDVEDILGARRAVNRQAALVAFVLNAGHRGQQAVEVAVARQLHEDFLGHGRALGGRLDVDQGALPDDRDLLGQRALGQDDVQGDGLFQLEDDVLPLDRLEALQAEGQVVGPRRQGEQPV